mmetsp:Transcript_28476/g.44297  ORF Transcript_28476/g.44297 Transcript_28476/m.44297 type:complete len:90 (+) Transcript_28476:1529-1798(+)
MIITTRGDKISTTYNMFILYGQRKQCIHRITKLVEIPADVDEHRNVVIDDDLRALCRSAHIKQSAIKEPSFQPRANDFLLCFQQLHHVR